MARKNKTGAADAETDFDDDVDPSAAKMLDPKAMQKKMKKLAGSDEQLLKYIPGIFGAGLTPQQCSVSSSRLAARVWASATVLHPEFSPGKL